MGNSQKILFLVPIVFALLAIETFSSSSLYSPSLCSGEWHFCDNAFTQDGADARAQITVRRDKTGDWSNYGISIPENSIVMQVSILPTFFSRDGDGNLAIQVSGDGGQTFGPQHIIQGNQEKQTYVIDATNDFTWNPDSLSDNSFIVRATCFAFNGTKGGSSCKLDSINVQVEFEEPFLEERGCEQSFIPFMQPGLLHLATIEYNLTNVSQFTNTSRTTNGCSPASATSAAEFLNRSGAIKNMSSINDTYDELSHYMNTSAGGTRTSDELSGWLKWLVNHSANVTVKFYMNVSDATSSAINATAGNITNGTHVTFTHVDVTPNITHIINEMLSGEVITIGLVNRTVRWGHTMAVDDVNTTQKPNGCYDISFMDPEGGPPGGRRVFAEACDSTIHFQNSFRGRIVNLIVTSPKT